MHHDKSPVEMELRGPTRPIDWTVMWFGMLFPTLITWIYFVALAGKEPQWLAQAAYLVGKTLQFALPIAWIGLVLREPLRWPRPSSKGLLQGAVFGLVIVTAMAIIYFTWLRETDVFATVAVKVNQKLAETGIDGLAAFAALGIFYSLVHSLLEEYYWRWFIFGQLHRLAPLWTAILLSSLGFMAHHVIVLALYFGWDSPWTYFFSLSTAVGGAYWAWLYQRTGSIYGAWLSHLIIDAGIFAIGWDLVRASGAT